MPNEICAAHAWLALVEAPDGTDVCLVCFSAAYLIPVELVAKGAAALWGKTIELN